MPSPTTSDYSQVSEEQWDPDTLWSQLFNLPVEDSGGSMIENASDKQDILVSDIFKGQAISQASTASGTFFEGLSESPQLFSYPQLEGPVLSAFQEENADASTTLFLPDQDLTTPTKAIFNDILFSDCVPAHERPQDFSDFFCHDPHAGMIVPDAALWAMLLDGEVDLGAGDHSQVATTLPIHDVQPAMNFDEAEYSAISHDDPVGDASIGTEHHPEVTIGPPSHNQQAVTNIVDVEYSTMGPLHGPVGYEGIDANHRIIPNSRAFRAARRISSNPPNGRGAWQRRTRPAIYHCTVTHCGDTFTTNERLKTHYNRFHAPPEQQTRYPCLYCNEYDTTYRDDLRRHVQRCPQRPFP